MRPGARDVLHFSEDPTITVFEPRVAATAAQSTPYVWAVEAARAPDYWFPRECPRAMAWAVDSMTAEDRAVVLGVADRVHVIEYGWLSRLQTARVYVYRFSRRDFEPLELHAYVATHPVRPLAPPEPVGDLLALHEGAGIELRVTTALWPFVDLAAASTAGFSGIRLHNARPR
jgi:uncharacterized protein DUF6886